MIDTTATAAVVSAVVAVAVNTLTLLIWNIQVGILLQTTAVTDSM